MKLKLPPSIATPQDLNELIQSVRSYGSWLAHQSVVKQVHAKKGTEPPALNEAVKTLISSWHNKNQPTRKSIDSLLAELEDYKQQATVITITLAGPAPKSLKTQLTTWCRKNLQAEILVNFSFDTTILGGMVVRFGSHIHDWSFRRQILDNQANFTEVLRRV